MSNIAIMRTSDGCSKYAFRIQFILELANMPADECDDAIIEHADTWVSEHEGRNSVECDMMIERLAEAISVQVETYLELQAYEKTVGYFEDWSEA